MKIHLIHTIVETVKISAGVEVIINRTVRRTIDEKPVITLNEGDYHEEDRNGPNCSKANSGLALYP